MLENQHKRSIDDDLMHLKMLMPWFGSFKLDRIHKGSLEPWIDGLKIVWRVLNLAAGEWVGKQGLTWLHSAPKIKLLPDLNKRQPYPLSWPEQLA